MKTYKYSTHTVSRCHYIYPILNVNVESEYINSDSGFSEISKAIQDVQPIIIPSDSKHEATGTELSGYFDFEFVLQSEWNILVVTDSTSTPLSIIYDTYSLNTATVGKIHLTYEIFYESSSIDVRLNIGSEYMEHMNEYIGPNMQPIPKMLSRSYNTSLVQWTDSEYSMQYDNLILKDNKSSFDYLLKIDPNLTGSPESPLTYNPNYEYYLTGSTQDMFIIAVTPGTRNGIIYALNDWNSSLATIPNLPVNISHIEMVENGYGFIIVTKDNSIYYSSASNGRNGWQFNPVTQLDPLTNFDLLIPTFMDLCGCYVKVPNPRTKTPTAYQVKKWTSIFDESDTYGDMIYADVYDNPDSKAPGDCNIKANYWESLGLTNNKTYFRASGISQNSPVSMHEFDCMSPTEGNSAILDMNLRLMTCLYVDLLNNDRLNARIIPRDCGLEIIKPVNTGTKDFITYTGDHYEIPVDANIMNMGYYINTSESSKIVSLESGRTQNLASPILCAKYGVVITRAMLGGN